MAAIDNLIMAVPEVREGVPGFKLTWPENQPSPEWLSDEALTNLWNLHTPERRTVIDRAKLAGIPFADTDSTKNN